MRLKWLMALSSRFALRCTTFLLVKVECARPKQTSIQDDLDVRRQIVSRGTVSIWKWQMTTVQKFVNWKFMTSHISTREFNWDAFVIINQSFIINRSRFNLTRQHWNWLLSPRNLTSPKISWIFTFTRRTRLWKFLIANTVTSWRVQEAKRTLTLTFETLTTTAMEWRGLPRRRNSTTVYLFKLGVQFYLRIQRPKNLPNAKRRIDS